MSDAFISYSRRDGDFAKRLTNALKRAQRDVWIDWEDIPRGADWLSEIFSGIDAADTLVFIVSKHSLTSEICNDELRYARQHNKRIIPLIRQEIDDQVEAEVRAHWESVAWRAVGQENWTQIGHLNWIFFNDDSKFDAEFDALLQTLDTDLDHVKYHTRLLVRARDWDTRGRNPSHLLIGDGIDSAEKWMRDARSHGKTPEPTALHLEYISASREIDLAKKAEDERVQRRVRNFRRASAVLGVMVLLALVAIVNAVLAANNAQTQRDIAFAVGTQSAAEATLFALQQGRVSTLSAGNVIVNIADLEPTPEAFLATETAIAVLSQWQPEIQTFDGVPMVKVPAGCFWMGSIIEVNEQPVHEVCFDAPYWIDQYEVSNQQFVALDGAAQFDTDWTDDRPRTSVTWFEARDYCEARGARLPTEAEWEYAARGVQSLVYPWGNVFDEANVAYFENSTEPDAIASRTDGQSWVGAYHMSGNVWEWVSTIDDNLDRYPYPYATDDGREDPDDSELERSMRGGAINSGTDLVRGADRFRDVPQAAYRLVGFRCARSE